VCHFRPLPNAADRPLIPLALRTGREEVTRVRRAEGDLLWLKRGEDHGEEKQEVDQAGMPGWGVGFFGGPRSSRAS
jgi:hypothetical protein